ncbi:MAG: aminotransferase class I/II-fold pyridoxal phosphate-dependent enzyme [Candidatus Aenigmarchaeota archaeon]|nr:aminotransferase class I/II-fold pyridoxal phosphate-dependent enzyme [Candidatus Aenigmarchaeota archaeon]
MPLLSDYTKTLEPSAIRLAGKVFSERFDKDSIRAYNVAIGNVSLPSFEVMGTELIPIFDEEGNVIKERRVVKYTDTSGTEEAKDAFRHIIGLNGVDVKDKYAIITSTGSSSGMMYTELLTGGMVNEIDRSIMGFAPLYANYMQFADMFKIKIAAINRILEQNGKFTMPSEQEIERFIKEHNPNALILIPNDNPTGSHITQEQINQIAMTAVKYDIWLIEDAAYRGMCYTGHSVSSIWNISENQIPGITGRRISLESFSKYLNYCGGRAGAMFTDSKEFYDAFYAAQTALLCASTEMQEEIAKLQNVSKSSFDAWLANLNNYYKRMMESFVTDIRKELSGVIISNPDAALYSVVDVRKIAKPGFNAKDFVLYCAGKGAIVYNENDIKTALVAPMAGFYSNEEGKTLGKTQMRIAYVLWPEEMIKVPRLFADLFKEFEANR